jgi:hypothetical protein
MIITKKKFYSGLFIALLLLQLYLPSFKINILLQCFFLGTFFFIEKITIDIKFFKVLKNILLILLIGFLGAIIYRYSLSQIIKDILHFLKPILGLLIGYVFFKKVNDKSYFIKIVIIAGLISAFIHFFILMVFSDFTSGNIGAIRQFSRDNFLELIALFFLIFYKKITNNVFHKKSFWLCIIILTSSSVLYFSRTMLLVTIVLFLTINGYTRITSKTINYLVLFTLITSLFYLILFNTKIERNKPGLEAFLYKIKIAPQEIFKTKIDRENHKDLWDHWRGYEAKRAIALMEKKPSSFVFGTGFGSLVNLKFNAPLADNQKGLKYISELHNGYVYILYKTGAIGLLIYFYFLFTLYREINKKETFERTYISAIGLIYFITTLTITGVFNNRDIFVFILGALLFFNSQKKVSL